MTIDREPGMEFAVVTEEAHAVTGPATEQEPAAASPAAERGPVATDLAAEQGRAAADLAAKQRQAATDLALNQGAAAVDDAATAVLSLVEELRRSGAFSPVYTPGEMARAFASVRDEMNELPDEEVGVINVSVRTVVLVVLGGLEVMNAFLEEVIEVLPKHNVAQLGRVRTYALALLYADAHAPAPAATPSNVQTLLADAMPLRERLLGLAGGYASYGLLDPERVAAIRRGTGHVDAAHDLIDLAELFREGGAKLEGKTPITPDELDRAEVLGMQILFALGQRAVGAEGAPAPRGDDCARAFRLMVRAYDQFRRAMTYLRWNEGDAAALAPSLFARRRGRGTPAAPPPIDGGVDEAPE